MFSPDDGATWQPLKLNLPTVAVHDLVVKDDDLVVGTHGRSIWILDDLTPVREWSGAIGGEAGRTSSRARPPRAGGYAAPSAATRGAGQNPPAGAIAAATGSRSKPKGEVTIEMLDGKGDVVRRADQPEGASRRRRRTTRTRATTRPRRSRCRPKAGVQRAVWDLRYEGATQIKGAKIDSGEPGRGPAGPARAPTRLSLTVDGQTLTTPGRGAARSAGERAQGRPRGAARLRPRAARGPQPLSGDRPGPALGARAGEGPRGHPEGATRPPRRCRRPAGASPRGATRSRTKLHNPEAQVVVRHPRDAGRGEALLAARPALLVVQEGDGPADPGRCASVVRGAEGGARRAPRRSGRRSSRPTYRPSTRGARAGPRVVVAPAAR